MVSTQNRLALISPLKNEIENLPVLINSIENQTIPIDMWIIVDDQSTDGSGEYLQNYSSKIKNVNNFIVHHLDILSSDYGLGFKYSKVVAYGFDILFKQECKTGVTYDYIGILDTDCILHKNYYEKILEKFHVLPKLGLASGVIFYKTSDGKFKRDHEPERCARGPVRVWRGDCIRETGYRPGLSADSISSANAWSCGWHCQGFTDSIAYARQMGKRVDHSYYGEAAYYLGIPQWYVLLKSLLLFSRSSKESAEKYIQGYKSAKKNNNRIKDKKVSSYYKNIVIRNILETIIVSNNKVKLHFNKS